jgi:radical SAM protein with 4Fe4S-binding SPASM domain
MSVNAEGVVIPCAYDFHKTQAFGHVGDGQSFLDAWWSEKAEIFRRRFTDAKSVFPFCRDCAYRDSGTCECTLETKQINK